MAHQIETIAYAHETPWHGLGKNVEASITVDDMLIASGLNWQVKQEPCFAIIGDNMVSVGRSALYRDTDNKVLTITGSYWKPLQNKQALEFFREYTEAGGATLETVGSLRGGRIVWGLAKVATGFSILNGRDQVNGYILLVSPHEVGQSITVRTTSVRVVCANTLAMAGGVKGKHAEYRQSHVKTFDIKAAKQTVQMVKEQIEQLRLDADALLSLKMSEYDTVRFLAKFFQPAEAGLETEEHVSLLINDPSLQNSHLQGVLWATEKAPGATPGNGWGVLNGVTYWVDHMAGRSAEARLFNSWLGDTGRTKANVMNGLLELV